MRAYNLAVLMIFINMGFVLLDAFGVFPSMSTPGILGALQLVFNPAVVLVISAFMVLGTTVFANAGVPTDRGIAYKYMTLLFWSSFALTGVVLSQFYVIPGFSIFYMMYSMACSIIFIIGLIQMGSGGQRMNV